MDNHCAICLLEEVKYCCWSDAEGEGEDCVAKSAEGEKGDNKGQV